jgi:hypothetical protein
MAGDVVGRPIGAVGIAGLRTYDTSSRIVLFGSYLEMREKRRLLKPYPSTLPAGPLTGALRLFRRPPHDQV